MAFRSKLFLAILGTTAFTALLLTLALYKGAGGQLQSFIRAQEEQRLAQLAEALGERLDMTTWQRLEAAPMARQLVLRRTLATTLAEGPGTQAQADRRAGMRQSRLAPLPGGLRWETQPPPDSNALLWYPIRIDGQLAGGLSMRSRTAWQSLAEQRFRQAQRRRALLALVLAMLGSAAVAALLTRALHRPIRQIIQETGSLAEGKRERPWDLARRDEFGQLHRALADLDRALIHAEQQQRQWLSDTAHELRTPLSILRGELEAIEDGVRAWNDAALKSLLAEVAHLQHMVNTLHELSLAESDRLPLKREPIDLRDWLEPALQRHAAICAQAGLTLDTQLGDRSLPVLADSHRLQQILDNLLDNAVRYTQTPGSITVTLSRGRQHARLTICDSAPAPSSAQLPHLFDRFYRADAARGGSGTGLGLAIVKALVTQHGGSVHARRSELGGLCVELELALQNQGDRNAL